MTDHLVDADPAASDDDGAGPSGLPAPSADALVSTDDAPGAVTAPDTSAATSTTSRWSRWREYRRNRVNRWDRPPPPKDWRYFVGGFGRILIVTGLLMFGFVAYQLWGTGIETARAQSKLGNEFDEQISSATADDEPAIGIENWVVPRRPLDDSGDGTATDGDADDQPVVPAPGEPSDIVPGGVDLTDYAVEHDVPVVPGEAFARLEIPKIGRSDYVVPGVRVADLKKGPGHYPDTPLPGQLGNASIAGHRTTYGAPFFDLDQLAPGDELLVTMVTGDRFVYRVTGLQVVTAADSWVITTRDPKVAELTLTTCHPKYTARDRLVVHSVLVPEKSAQVGIAEFYDVDESGVDDEPIPGDDPTFSDTVDDETSAPVEADEPAAADGPAAADVTVPTIDPEPADPGDETDTAPNAGDDDVPQPDGEPADAVGPEQDGDPDEAAAPAVGIDPDEAAAPAVGIDPDQSEIDAFEQGWFDDREAFPQIALWASVLILVCVFGYQVAKRTRHTSIGLLVSFAPFIVALYFFYQNVNRLLPPGL